MTRTAAVIVAAVLVAVAVIATRVEVPSTRDALVQSDGGPLRLLQSQRFRSGQSFSAEWSPDSRRLLMVVDKPLSKSDLVLVEIDETSVSSRVLASDLGSALAPIAWSRDGQSFVVVDDYSGMLRLFSAVDLKEIRRQELKPRIDGLALAVGRHTLAVSGDGKSIWIGVVQLQYRQAERLTLAVRLSLDDLSVLEHAEAINPASGWQVSASNEWGRIVSYPDGPHLEWTASGLRLTHLLHAKPAGAGGNPPLDVERHFAVGINLESGREAFPPFELPHDNDASTDRGLWGIQVSDDNNRLVSVMGRGNQLGKDLSRDRTFDVFDLVARRRIAKVGGRVDTVDDFDSDDLSAVITPNGRWLLAATDSRQPRNKDDRSLVAVDLSDGRTVQRIPSDQLKGPDLVFLSPSGRRLVALSGIGAQAARLDVYQVN